MNAFFLGGLTCDSDDYYNSEQHVNAIFLPKYSKKRDQFIGFFNTGAYQDSLSGVGGIKHCLIPEPKRVIIQKDESGELNFELFEQQNSAKNMLKILGY
jgi:arginine decarboxylase